jgi:hypothetical protein
MTCLRIYPTESSPIGVALKKLFVNNIVGSSGSAKLFVFFTWLDACRK